MRGSRCLARTRGSLSPSRIAFRIACPVVPLISLITWASLHVHLPQCFLHVLNTAGSVGDMLLSLSPARPHRQDLFFRTERIPRQPVSVQLQQPLTLLDVRLSPRQIFVSSAFTRNTSILRAAGMSYRAISYTPVDCDFESLPRGRTAGFTPAARRQTGDRLRTGAMRKHGHKSARFASALTAEPRLPALSPGLALSF
jgi:hypothetical protein